MTKTQAHSHSTLSLSLSLTHTVTLLIYVHLHFQIVVFQVLFIFLTGAADGDILCIFICTPSFYYIFSYPLLFSLLACLSLDIVILYTAYNVITETTQREMKK